MSEPANRKCIVNNCENRANQGRFFGSLCGPCHRFLSGEDERHSQAGRNIRLAVEQATAELKTEIEKLREALEGMIKITDDSSGAAGYHPDGGVAEWGEFDELNAARTALKETK